MSSYSPNIFPEPGTPQQDNPRMEVTAGMQKDEWHIIPDICFLLGNEITISWLCFYIDFYFTR